MPETELFAKLKLVNTGLRRRYPRGNEPFQIMTRLLEECGELAEQVNLFEDTGIKRTKLGEPDRAKMAKEVMDSCVVSRKSPTIMGLSRNWLCLSTHRWIR